MRMLARSVLIMELFVMGFALLLEKDRPTNEGLVIGGLIMAAAFIASGLLKRKIGWVIGWITQFAMIAYGHFVFTMYFMGGLFLGLWVAAIIVGRKGEAIRAAHLEASKDKKGE